MTQTDESFAYQNFDFIFKQTLQELGVNRSVERYRIIANPGAPFFIISIKFGRARSAIKVLDMAQLNAHTGGTTITITDENWAPALLTKLWQNYGRDRVEQLTRYEILVHDAVMDELERLELDPGEELRVKLLDAVWRIFPEGFTVRYDIVDDKAMTIIGTEHDMKEEWIKIARMVHDEVRGKEGQ